MLVSGLKSSLKSSMARNLLIEVIREARYDLETCARNQRAACQRKLDGLLRQALERAHSAVRPEQLLDALFDDYREFKRGIKHEEWARLQRGQ